MREKERTVCVCVRRERNDSVFFSLLFYCGLFYIFLLPLCLSLALKRKKQEHPDCEEKEAGGDKEEERQEKSGSEESAF